MRLSRKRILAGFAASFALGALPAHSAKITTLGQYEFSTGSEGYTSHSGSAGVARRFKNKARLSGRFSFFTDDDYSHIESASVRLDGPVSRNWDAAGGLSLWGGKLKEGPSTTAVSTELEAVRYLPDNFEASAGWRFTHGSFAYGSNRALVRDHSPSHYIAHTLSAGAGREFGLLREGLYLGVRFALTFNSDSSRLAEEGIESSIGLAKGLYLGLFYTFTQHTLTADRNYVSIGLTKIF